MQLTPRYDGTPILRIEADLGDVAVPLLRQRRRLAATLDGLDEGQWATASRCEGWSVRDVISHLVTTNQFWALSILQGRAGAPTRFLATFDPVASPAQLVDAARDVPPADVLDRLVESTDAMEAALAGLDADGWATIAEAPPGHVSLQELALHAMWDSWIHERDVDIPLGLAQEIEADEVLGCLRYAVALGPAFASSTGSTRTGVLGVDATDPGLTLLVDVGVDVVTRDAEIPAGTPTLRGPAIDLLEALAFRIDLEHDISDDDAWLLGGLDVVFDRAG